MKNFYLSFLVLFFISKAASGQSCTPAVNGTQYWITTDADGGTGSLRQAILDANAANIGGTIEINGGWFNFPIFSPLPLITCDSLQIFPYGAPITIDGQGMVMEPAITFASATSCFDYWVHGINMIGGIITVTNNNESGAGSLREAIRSSNFSSSSDQIRFSIPGTAPHKIQFTASIGRITRPVSIDGSTQPANGYGGTAPKIEIAGPGGTTTTGFSFEYADSLNQFDGSVYGMYIHGFGTAVRTEACNNFILGAPGKGNVISGNNSATFLYADLNTIQQNNFIGTDTSGTVAELNNYGLSIAGSDSATHLINNNVISGNLTGVLIYSGTRNLTIKGNLVGTDKTGSFSIPNQDQGVSCSGSGVIIGGTTPSDANLFSGNGSPNFTVEKAALAIHGDSCIVIGNKFGTNLAGTDSVSNLYGSAIYLNPAAKYIRIGGTTPAERNIISSSPVGISNLLGLNHIIQGNYFGLDITGTIPLPNGVAISLGGDSSQITGNIIANSVDNGIQFVNGGHNNLVMNNQVINNNQNGIWNWGNENTFLQNVIDGNGLEGIFHYLLANDSIQPPALTQVTTSNVQGTSVPFAEIELYESAPYNLLPQGSVFIAGATADVNGDWSYTGSVANPLYVTATQTDPNGNTSAFSPLWPQVAPDVWPGDCNYDLVVDNYDFLYLGMAISNTGPIRAGASLNWIAQPSVDWSTTYTSGINHKHADCDGNGIANMTDVNAINLNYGLTHPFRLMPPNNNASATYDFYVQAQNDTIAPGSYAVFDIYAGTVASPIDSIYGFAWTLNWDPSLVVAAGISNDYSISALGTWHSGMESFEQSFYATGSTELAIARTTQTDSTQLYGKIGSIILPVSSGISTVNVLSLVPSDIKGITFGETNVVFNFGGDSVIIDPAFTGISQGQENQTFKLFPNPASDEVYISFSNAADRAVSLIDVTGRVMMTINASGKQAELNLRNLASGVYVMEARDASGKILRSTLIVRK